MYRQVIQGSNKTFFVLLLIFVTTVTSVNAQLSMPVKAKIPFDFNVGETKLSAGDYTFSRVAGFSNNTMSVSNATGKGHAFQTILNSIAFEPKRDSVLIFHKYDDQYFLEQIWRAGEVEGTQLPESGSERAVRLQIAATNRGVNSASASKVETIEILFH